MNDGCGQMSIITARNVAMCLGFGDNDMLPGGFQGRIGNAKGFWLIDYECKEDRITVYPSQTKWKMNRASPFELDPDQRTFEVLDWAKNLKPATLNLQLLPILEHGAQEKAGMRMAIDKILVSSLSHDLSRLSAAMESPETLRKWLRDTHPGISDRLRHDGVLFIAGLPSCKDERANLLLESGFTPQKISYLKELIRGLVVSRCEDLNSRLSITVGQSCYAYIAVDFTGTLKENEIHLCFSAPFIDEHSGFNDILLDGMDVLITRSPAHLPSDIQKVKAVFHKNLRLHKNIILCSGLGDSPLAGKLSGGDYDGDIAWICWDQTLVQPFQNSAVLEPVDLVRKGYLLKDNSRFSDMSGDSGGIIFSFLEKAFHFNLEASMLGICTTFKENVTYTQNSVATRESNLLGGLLSCLVDAPKQGYRLTEELWNGLKANEIKTNLTEIAYKGTCPPRVIKHIVDHLKFVTAKGSIDETLKELNRKLGSDAYNFDTQLLDRFRWAEQQTERDHETKGPNPPSEWLSILEYLKADLEELKKQWDKRMSRGDRIDMKSEDSRSQILAALQELHEIYLAISPHTNTPLTRLLTYGPSRGYDFSPWELLKASTAFAHHHHRGSNFIWRLAGKQLCALKAEQHSAGERRMINSMYAMMKPDPTYVKLLQNEVDEPRNRQARAESMIVELDEEVNGGDE